MENMKISCGTCAHLTYEDEYSGVGVCEKFKDETLIERTRIYWDKPKTDECWKEQNDGNLYTP